MTKVSSLAVAILFLPGIIFAKDPEVMKINGKSIKLSEFEYLYNKNKQQQIEPQSFDQYVDMFVNYKLKVADAEAAGIDTTKSFNREFDAYCRDLAKPFIEDASVKDSLEHEAYNWMTEEVDVSHLMLPLVDTLTNSRKDAKALADTVLAMMRRGDNFQVLVLRYSCDPAKTYNVGHMGYLPWGKVPYTFERAAHNTEVGKYSEVVETPFGFHIIKVNNKRPFKTVHVQHILKLVPKNADSTTIEKTKASIDSIYKAVLNGADFSELAKQESEDPGSKVNGGELPWIGSGQTVPEFEEEAFKLGVGEVCAPFRTSFGYHIIKKMGEKGAPTFEEMLPAIRQAIANDDRANEPSRRKIEQLKTKYNFVVNNVVIDNLFSSLPQSSKIDSAFISNALLNPTVIATYTGGNIKVSDVAKNLKPSQTIAENDSRYIFDRAKDLTIDNAIVTAEIESLKTENTDYKNITNEYRDGLLLFEISNRNVWNKANQDNDGLNAYFESHRENYKWDKPRYKGYLIQVANDSIARDVKTKLLTISNDSLARVLKRDYKRYIKIEKMLVSKGDNVLIDACVFDNDSSVENPNKKLPIYFTHDGKVIDNPEEMNDVRSLVTVDYQNFLEQEWIKNLHNKYKIKINKKNLNKVQK